MLATSWNKLDSGGADEIEEWIESVSEPRLIVLDTLAAVRPKQQGDTQYQNDYRSIEKLQKIAGEKHLAILVLAHDRKMAADDPIDSVSATLGLTGSADGIAIIMRTSQGTTLYLRGRDIEEQELAIVFEPKTCRWSVLGNAGHIHRSDTRQKIQDVLAKATSLLTADEIASACDNVKATAVRQQLSRMTAQGEVAKASRGRYALPERADLLRGKTKATSPKLKVIAGKLAPFKP
jgi:hypothetical protein